MKSIAKNDDVEPAWVAFGIDRVADFDQETLEFADYYQDLSPEERQSLWDLVVVRS
ncbi:hypothetical protein [Chromatium okenii]|uniref:hypothetical protein n=1 Tax=Chromatium okenii TaxID=61644 RepID=UPI001559292F|nr:hypothetical protein [Chromatium okenii]MBV5310608.1 hypothetical protein [Chromatium okenii]